MAKNKVIKDAVHGYIEIESKYMQIIDSILFQRLRRIEQTSYRVLYPSARHDRFIHSIGVFHLGKKAFTYFKKNIQEDEPEITRDITPEFWDCCEISFIIACLLHDIGHAPFSHTTEDFFAQKKFISAGNPISVIEKRLHEVINSIYTSNPDTSKRFSSEYDKCAKKPSPHEIVSSVIMAEEFGDIITELGGDIELSVRMIIGCTYSFIAKDTKMERYQNGLKNCLIRLLNSLTIDVDKLDYIMRDTKMTGYENIMIDAERLLQSVTGITYSKDDLYPAYKKNALSVVENVVSAKSSQNIWIINHHSVVYEAYLIQSGIRAIAEKISTEMCSSGTVMSKDEVIEKLFSIEAIKGPVQIGHRKICYLSDDDIWSLFKEYCDISIINELLSRKDRKRPIWKSFAEYNYLFKSDKSEMSEEDYKNFYESFRILINSVDTDMKKTVDDSLKSELLKRYKEDDERLNALWVLIKLAEEKKIGFEFVLLKSRKEEKNLIRDDELFIRFGSEKGPLSFSTVMGRSKEENTKAGALDYFYLYHKQKINRNDFVEEVKSICSYRPKT